MNDIGNIIEDKTSEYKKEISLHVSWLKYVDSKKNKEKFY